MGSASQQYLDVLTNITREGGATRAATQRANAAIWGGAISKLGDYASDAVKSYAVDKKAKKAEKWEQDLADLFKRSTDEFKAQQEPSMAELTAGAPTTTETYTPGGLQGSFAGNIPQSHVTTETTAAPQTFTGPELKNARPPRSSPFPSPSEIMSLGNPIGGMKVIDGLAALQKLHPQDDEKTRVERMRAAYVGLDQFSEKEKAAMLPGLMGAFEQVYGVNLGEKAFTPERWAAFGKALQIPKGAGEDLVPIPGPDGKPVYGPKKVGQPVYEKESDRLVPVPGPDGPVYGTPTAGAPVYEKVGAAGAGSDFAQYLARVAKEKNKTVDQLTAAEELAARKAYGQADDRTITISPTMQAEQSNAKETALGIKDGTISPEVLLSTRATAQGMALNAELHKLGVNTDKMTREWSATKRAIASLNSNQQVRLAQAIGKASASLDKVEELNKQWGQMATRFGLKIANRAELKAAQNGAYGPEAASVAQRLDGQIADVTSEIGQVVMGGNSPTDHGLELAGKNLSSDWTQKVLTDSIGQVRYNLNLADKARNEMLGQLGVTSTQFQPPPPANTAPPSAPKVNPFR